MWKKNEVTDSSTRPTTPSQSVPEVVPPAAARIGGSLSIKGDLYGEEDLFIEGRIEGKITVKKGNVTVGEQGRVRADVEAMNIRVAGEVEGNLLGVDQVVLLETGRVQGNIKAKSVTLENGARFKGSIDMESAGKGKGSPSSLSSPGGGVSGKAIGSSHSVSSTPRM